MKKFVIISIISVLALTSMAQDGSYDLSFSGDGALSFRFGGTVCHARSIVRQNDGMYITAGFTSISNQSSFAIARVTEAGLPDEGFGDHGKVTALMGTNSELYSIALQADGKIVGCGYNKYASNTSFSVVRYNSDGSPDNTFSGNGEFTYTVNSSFNNIATRINIAPDGKILIAGSCQNSSNETIVLLRLLPEGVLDTTFGNAGVAEYQTGKSNLIVNDALLQQNGSILVCGSYHINFSEDAYIIRFTEDGAVDTTFGANGISIIKSTQNDDYCTSIALNSFGNIVAVGYMDSTYDVPFITMLDSAGITDPLFNLQPVSLLFPGSNTRFQKVYADTSNNIYTCGGSYRSGYSDFVLLKLSPEGNNITTFGDSGIVVDDLFGTNDVALDFLLEDNGNIVVSGYSNIVNKVGFALSRYNPDGSRDTDFDKGKISFVSSPAIAIANDMVLQTDGKLCFAGISSGYPAVVRIMSDGIIDSAFGSNGISVFASTVFWSANSIAIQPDQKILFAGYVPNKFCVVRLNPDGVTDSTFGINGAAFSEYYSGSLYARSMALQSDGKIIVAGDIQDKIAVMRFLSDGTLDNSFGINGVTLFNNSLGGSHGYKVYLQNDGKILVAGDGYSGSQFAMAVIRLNTDGSVDTGFGNSGIVFKNEANIATGICVDSDGRIVLFGKYASGGLNYYAFARLNQNGSSDNSFNSTGSVVISIPGASIMTGELIVQSDASILGMGSTYNGEDYDIILVQVTGDGILDSQFDLDGIKIIDVHGSGEKAVCGIMQSDGRFYIGGSSAISSGSIALVMRLNGTAVENIETIFSDRNNISIYPNPFSDFINIKFADKQDQVYIKCCDLAGRLLFAKEYYDTGIVSIPMDKVRTNVFVTITSKNGLSESSVLIKLD